MNEQSQTGRSVVNVEELPSQYPTHRHDPKFWEYLGRTIATFGFLEEILGKAIFSFTATRVYKDSDLDEECHKWLRTLERVLSDPLGGLITSYEQSVREHPDATIDNLGDLVADLRQASTIRNVLCHGSWRVPDEPGGSIPFFFTRQNKVFDTVVDISFLQTTQKKAANLAVFVVCTVTHMGWQFPGSSSPGDSITGDMFSLPRPNL